MASDGCVDHDPSEGCGRVSAGCYWADGGVARFGHSAVGRRINRKIKNSNVSWKDELGNFRFQICCCPFMKGKDASIDVEYIRQMQESAAEQQRQRQQQR